MLAHLAEGRCGSIRSGSIDDDWDDCRIDAGSPTTSFCGSANDEVGYNGTNDHRSLVIFNLGSVIPTDAVVTEAEMGMYLYSHSTSTAKQVGVYRATQAWTDSATWNKYNSSSSWTTAGGDYSSTYGAVTSGKPS